MFEPSDTYLINAPPHGRHHCPSDLYCWLPPCVVLLTHFLFPVCRLWRLKKVWVRFCSRWAFRAVRTSLSRTSGLWSTNKPSSCSAPHTKRRPSTVAACCSETCDTPETTCITDTPEPGTTTPVWSLCADHRGAAGRETDRKTHRNKRRRVLLTIFKDCLCYSWNTNFSLLLNQFESELWRIKGD